MTDSKPAHATIDAWGRAASGHFAWRKCHIADQLLQSKLKATQKISAAKTLLRGPSSQQIVQRAFSTSTLKISTPSHGLRPAALWRSASDRRSPPLISTVLSFNWNISNGTAALIATSGSPCASSPS